LAATSFTLTMWMRKPDYYISEWGDALASWTHHGALDKDAPHEKRSTYMALLMMPDSSLNLTATHEGVTCGSVSPPVQHLKDGKWHYVAMAVDDHKQTVVFYVDAGKAETTMACFWVSTPPPPPSPPPSPPSPPPPSPPPSPPSPPPPPPSPPSPPPLRYKSPDHTAKGAGAAVVASRALLAATDTSSAHPAPPPPPPQSRVFDYRSTPAARERHATFIVGAAYDDAADQMIHVFDGQVDEVELFHRALDAEELSQMQSETPCAKRFKGDGFAYFPGLTATKGPEWIEWDAVPQCRPGPHTVRFRYLVAQGNNRNLVRRCVQVEPG
jgi:hypothetical protein